MTAADLPAIDTAEIAAGAFRFHCRLAGPAEGAPVLLLHGFPESGAMWEPMMRALAAEGYRCVAPDQRGYSPGARPEAIEDYAVDHLTADVFALADALGWGRFHLVAHDWGAAVAWLAAIARPERLRSLTVLSIPHYRAFAEATWTDPEQAPYRAFLELVVAPGHAAERVLARDDFATFRNQWMHHHWTEIEKTLAIHRVSAAFTAALNWYRASDAHRRLLEREAAPVEVPTLLIWGSEDPYVRPMSIELGERIPTRDHRRPTLEAGHWLVQEKPAEVIAAIRDQLGRYCAVAPGSGLPVQREEDSV